MDTFTKKQRETLCHMMLDGYIHADIFETMAHYWTNMTDLLYDSCLIFQQLPGPRLVTFEVCVTEEGHPGPTDENAIKVALRQIGAHTGVEVKVVMVEWD
jgi:hypothetical protein